jgi:hypothetical protein
MKNKSIRNLSNCFSTILAVLVIVFVFAQTSITYAQVNTNTPVGYLEGIVDGSIISGWAADKDDVTRSIDVHVYVGGAAGASGHYLGSVTANRPRNDVLVNAGIAGNHGFHFQIPPAYRDGREHVYYVYGIDLTPNSTNPLLTWAPKSFTVPISTGGGTVTNSNTNKPVGYLEGLVESSIISGWAADKDDVTRPIDVHFYVDGAAGAGGLYIGSVTANRSRQDVLVNAGIAGNHGFHFQIPPAYQDGKTHSYYAYGIDLTSIANNTLLSWAPKSFTVGSSNTSVSTVNNTTNNYSNSYTGGYSSSNPPSYNYYNNYAYPQNYAYNQNYTPNYSYYPDYGYNQNYNYNQNYVYSPVTSSGLQIACFPDKVSARVGASVTWAIEAIGGSGNFTYAWTGSEGLSSNQSSVITTYGTTGQKSATVTVTSNGQTITQACGSKVNITSAYVAPRPTNNNYQNPQINYQNQQDNSLSAASLFSLKNVPWGWVAVLVILVLMFTVMYLIFNRNKI